MNSNSRLFGIIGFTFVVIGFLGKTVYRDYIHSNHINDLSFSDFLPSLFYVTGFSQMLLIATSKYPKATIVTVTLASVLFELKQYYSTSVIDIKDILASLIGGLISMCIWKLINEKNS
jgi:uncharacterized membrane protein YccC